MDIETRVVDGVAIVELSGKVIVVRVDAPDPGPFQPSPSRCRVGGLG